MIKLSSGKEVSEELLDNVIDALVTQYAGVGFEDFDDLMTSMVESLQEDDWLPDNNHLTYDEALEVSGLIKGAARQFANELADAYSNLMDKYVGTKSWESFK